MKWSQQNQELCYTQMEMNGGFFSLSALMKRQERGNLWQCQN